MGYISKTTRVIPNFAAQRKMESTLAHVSKGWFPLDPVLLQQINEKFQEGFYESNPRALLEDVKGDLALLSHTAKFIRARIEEPVAVLNPLRDLRFLPPDELERLFSISSHHVSKHKLSGCGKVRMQMLKNAVIAANTAEVFAGEARASGTAVDVDTAFSATAFQQIGWNLLSWNYPDLVSRTLRSTQRDRTEASIQLKSVLGISPNQMSAHFASSWLFEPLLGHSISGNNGLSIRENSEEKESLRVLASVKDAAESFAAIETGLASKKDEAIWEARQANLRTIIPDVDFSSVGKKVAEKSGAFLERLEYQTAAKRSIAVTQAISRSATESASRASAATERSFASNRYLQKCPEELQELFKPIYAAITDVGASITALETLVKDALPASGFSGGCIYLLDPLKANLVPAVKFGESHQVRGSKFQTLLETAALESFTSDTPMRKQEITDTGDVLEHVCASFGDAQRPGVLLLEVSERSAQAPDFDSTLVFKAVRQCLHHCLDIHPPRND